jgi:hypothetical protein
MMTLEELKVMPSNTVFASGITQDPRLFKEPVKWIAKRGVIHDWAIYYDVTNKSEDQIKSWGTKLYSPSIIKELVPCDEEMLKMYRQ